MRFAPFFPLLLLLALLPACGSDEVQHPWLYAVREGGLYGYVDEAGSKAIYPQFAYAVDFSESLGAVNIGGISTGGDWPETGRMGFIDPTGHFAINPRYLPPENGALPNDPERMSLVLHEGYRFSDGLAAVRTPKEWIYINRNDSVVIQGLGIRSARRFREGLAAVYMRNDETGRYAWGYIDKRGQVVIAPQFLLPSEFNNGYAVVLDSDKRTTCINQRGEKIFRQYRFETAFNDSVAAIREGFKAPGTLPGARSMMGLIRVAPGGGLREAVFPQFDKVGSFGSGLAPVLIGSRNSDTLRTPDDVIDYQHIGGKWGYISLNGQIMLNPNFDGATGFINGRATVRQGLLWGYIDSTGSMHGQAEFKYAGPFDGPLARVRFPGAVRGYESRAALVDKEGNVVWAEPE